MGRVCSKHGENKNVYWILLEKPEGKRPLARLTCWWEDNIKMDIREIGWGIRDWIHLAQDRDQRWTLVNTVIYLRVKRSVMKFLSS
jgi:hypothetical protein